MGLWERGHFKETTHTKMTDYREIMDGLKEVKNKYLFTICYYYYYYYNGTTNHINNSINNNNKKHVFFNIQ